MRRAVIWDVEFLTDVGAPMRFWCGPDDPDPVLVQIGAVRLALSGEFALLERFHKVVIPRTRAGGRWPIPALFTRLTGIDAARIDAEGCELGPALAALADFAEQDMIWAWGHDEFFGLGISCYLAGIAPPIPATRFGNATRLLVRAGAPAEEVITLRSNTLCAHFGVPDAGEVAHDALGDALSVARVLQHFLRTGALRADDFLRDRRGEA